MDNDNQPTESKLPPLSTEAFEFGRKEEASVHKEKALPKRCDHKGKVTLVSSTQLNCQCGTGWQGPDIVKLFDLLKNP